MNFDKSRVYTALNADELKVGSQVIVGDNLACLKELVEHETIQTLKEIRDDNCMSRFVVDEGIPYTLAYLVSEPEEKKLKWTDLKLGDVITKGNHIAMVTEIHKDCVEDLHIFAGSMWFNSTRLAEWEKVEE